MDLHVAADDSEAGATRTASKRHRCVPPLLASILFVLLVAGYLYASRVFIPTAPAFNPVDHVDISLLQHADEPTTSATRSVPKVLFWTSFFDQPDFGVGVGSEGYKRLKCPYVCENSVSRDDWPSSDAIVFHLRDKYWPLPRGRRKAQKWVFFSLESPLNVDVADERLKAVFNWTMTYVRASDVFIPYGSYKRRNVRVDGNASVALQESLRRRNGTAWVVSHCKTASQRENLFQKLQQHTPVTVLGACGQQACPGSHKACYHELAESYLFYLSWENSLCDDYVTEKAWLALSAGLVPVVYGGAQYDQLLPPHSFIDGTSFPSVRHLADYLNYLSANRTAFGEYLRWKDDYIVPTLQLGSSNPWCSSARSSTGRDAIPPPRESSYERSGRRRDSAAAGRATSSGYSPPTRSRGPHGC